MAAAGIVQVLSGGEARCEDYDRDLYSDGVDHVALVASELDVLFRRREIEKRGNPLMLEQIFKTALPTNYNVH